MNIFIIPSWYPSRNAPISGIFIKEQAIALGRFGRDLNIGISLWGQDLFNLPIKKPFYALRSFLDYSRAEEKVNQILPNLIEIFNPCLHWTRKISGGNLTKLIEKNMDNVKTFQKRFGKIEIIHSHISYPGGYIAMKLAENLGIPYLITEYMGPFPFETFLEKGRLSKILKEPLQRAKTIITISPSLAEKIRSFGIQNNIIPVPLLVDEDYFYPVVKEREDIFTFFTLGGMTPIKGIPDLLKAISLVVKVEKGLRFVMGGGGEFLDEYQGISKKLNIDSFITWRGPLNREEARNEFQRCDAFILTSHYETFGVVYAEALACGKPIIATRCGGPEYIINERNGYLVDVGSTEQIADAILRLKRNIQQYESQKIRMDFLNRFSMSAVVAQLKMIYDQCLREQ